MSANAGSAVPIGWDDLTQYLQTANQHLKGISFAPNKTLDNLKGVVEKPRGLVDSRAQQAARADSVSILSIAKDLNKDDLLDEAINSALITLRMGLQIALYVSAKYAEASGLASLRERAMSSRGNMSPEDQSEWAAKQETHAAITAFVFSYYVTWRFDSKDEKKFPAEVDFAGLPEPIAVGNQIRSIGSVLYHLGSYLKTAQTSAQFNRLVQLFMAAVLKELAARSGAFKYTEPFTNVNYKLDSTDFVVRGFEGKALNTTSAEFKRIEEKDIVGNHEMKRMLNRIAQMVVAYDIPRKMNPMMELGALPWIGVLQGKAGTGKSMGLGYLQTKSEDNCRGVGLPFRVLPIPNAIVSSLQGESARTYEQWWNVTFDPNFVTVAPVDDAEAVYLDRRSQSSSEGSKLVVMSHLRLTEGSTAINPGNVLQVHATNNADMIDVPVFSRYNFRIQVPGAETRNDYCDQMKVIGDSINKKTGSPIIKLDFPSDYKFLSDQGLMSREEAERKVESFTGFKDTGLQQLWEEVERKKLSSNSYDLYGTFFAALHKRFDQFTSRDVRNVTTNATSRLFGFDFPEEWLTDREKFVAKDYDTKKTMIIKEALAFQKGLTVAQVLFQEMVNYVESTIAMLDSGRKYRIRQQADEVLERKEAMKLADAEWLSRGEGFQQAAE